MIKKHIWLIHNIANKGFGGMWRVVAHFNFSCTLISKKTAFPYWPYCLPLATIIIPENILIKL